MSDIEYKVEKTACYPHEWFGGPTFNGHHTSNASCYYFPTEEAARENVRKLKETHDRNNQAALHKAQGNNAS